MSNLQTKILQRGLTFVPTPKITLDPIVQAVHAFGRKLKLNNYFSGLPTQLNFHKSEFTKKSTWTPKDDKIDKPVLSCLSNIFNEIQNLSIQPEAKNLDLKEYKEIDSLQNNKNIVIKKADKGSAVVIMQRAHYITEGYRQLNNLSHYKQIDAPLFQNNSVKISSILKDLFNSNRITKKELEFLSPPDNPRPRRFYMLPKIHKDKNTWPIPNYMPPGRPIVSDCSSESDNIAKFIDAYIKPKANIHPSYIKNTYDFLDKVLGKDLHENSLLITLDIESMYTNINHDEGIQAIKNAFSEVQNDDKFIAIMKLLEISLKFNDFEFDNKTFLQVSGTAMGHKYAPHYADIYMAEFEKQALAKCNHQPECYYRYLDDIFLIWSHGITNFNHFLHTFNSHRPSIKFKAQISKDSINFLDTTLFRTTENKLEAKVYFKPTDTHQLLHKQSFHPKHTFSGLIKSQITRFYNICSFPEDVETACRILFDALSKRNYSKRWLRKIKTQTLRILNKKQRPAADYQKPTSSSSGCGYCNSARCSTCKLVPTCHNFSGSLYSQTYSINAKLNCNSENIIYLFTCKLCDKQYVGETSCSLRERTNRHRSAINNCRHDSALYNHLAKYHTRQPEHTIDLYTLIPIEQIPDQGNEALNKQLRLEREYCWIDTLCTFEPYGLNVQRFEKFDPQNKLKQNIDVVYAVPYSKTATISAQIIKKHIKKLNKDSDSDIKIAVAYKKHKNLKDRLVRSKLK